MKERNFNEYLDVEVKIQIDFLCSDGSISLGNTIKEIDDDCGLPFVKLEGEHKNKVLNELQFNMARITDLDDMRELQKTINSVVRPIIENIWRKQKDKQ